MGMASEFKTFIARGNVVDLAVGVVIGAAFGKITTALVNGVIMPPIGLMIAGVKFSELKWILKPAGADPEAEPEVAILYGALINTMIEFLIIGFVIFLMVRTINNLKRKEAEAPSTPPAPSPTEVLLTEIRDALKAPAKAAPARKPAAKK